MPEPQPHTVTDEAVFVPEEVRSFDEFFETEKFRLFRALCLVTGNPAEAEDLTQDAFVRVLERWDRVARLENPTGYLYRTAMNAFRSWRRRAVVASRRTLALQPPTDDVAEADARDLVLHTLAPLPRRQRAAVVLVDLLGLSSEEAGSMLGIRAATVRTHAARAHEQLRSQVETGG